jgi:hypothetical protein
VVEFLAHPDIYLGILGYHFMALRKGQYADGHEWEEVVWYRDHRFLPAWHEIQDWMHTWTKDNLPEVITVNGKQVVVWFHDEVIFYAHD